MEATIQWVIEHGSLSMLVARDGRSLMVTRGALDRVFGFTAIPPDLSAGVGCDCGGLYRIGGNDETLVLPPRGQEKSARVTPDLDSGT